MEVMTGQLSIMNYNFQFPSPVGTRPLDYSDCAIDSLDEHHLDENKGIGASCPQGLYTWIGFHDLNGRTLCPPDKLSPTNISVDWNDNNTIDDTQVNKDINCDNNMITMNGYDDWNHLTYI